MNLALRELLQLSQKKLQFHFFLNESILSRMGFRMGTRNHIRLKYSNKFMPSTLPKVGPLTDCLMVQQERAGGQEAEGPRKLTKGEPPISCSETLV